MNGPGSNTVVRLRPADSAVPGAARPGASARYRRDTGSAAVRRPAARLRAGPALSAVAGLGFGAALGIYAMRLGIATPETAWRGLRAALVLFGAQPSIEALGFDLPPLPTLLQVPLALWPPLRSTTLGASVVSGAAIPLAAWALLGALRQLPLGRGLAWTLVAAFLVHPLTLYAAGTGAGQLLATALLLLSLRLLLAWSAGSESVPLVLAGFSLGLATLARYDLVFLGGALALVVALLAGHARTPRPDERLALAIAFGLPVLFPMGLWIVLTTLATGRPLGFLAAAAAALAPPAGSPVASTAPWVQYVVVAAVPAAALIPSAAAAVRQRQLRPPVVAVGAAFAMLPLPALLGSTFARVPVAYVDTLPAVAVGTLALGVAAAAIPHRVPALRLVPIVLAVLAIVPAYQALARTSEWGQEYARFLSAGQSAPSAGQMWASERALADDLTSMSHGRDVLVDDRHDYLPVFLAASPDRFITRADPDYRLALADPPGWADLVLVRTTPSGGQTEDAIGTVWPSLAAGRVPWAELVGEWPVTGSPAERYRLFRVLRVPPLVGR